MVFYTFVTRIIWPTCNSFFSDLVSQKVLAPFCCRADSSWFDHDMTTWSAGAFFHSQKSPARSPSPQLLEIVTLRPSNPVGIFCLWESASSAFSCSSLYLLLAQFTCTKWKIKQTASSDSIRSDAIHQIFVFGVFSDFGIPCVWLEWGLIYVIKLTCLPHASQVRDPLQKVAFLLGYLLNEGLDMLYILSFSFAHRKLQWFKLNALKLRISS